MKVLYISYDGMTDSLGQSQVLPYLTGLAKNNYEIDLISCEKSENFKKNKDLIIDIIKDTNIKWHPIKYHYKPAVFSTIWDVFKIIKLARKIYKNKKIDIVHCRSYISALAGLYLKNRYKIKFIFDMRGFWADERIDGDLWNLKNPVYYFVYKYFKKKEKQFIINADYIISLTENAKLEINSWKLTSQPLNIQVIPCCVDTNLFNENNLNINKIEGLKTELKIKNSDLVISYLGSIGTWYLLDEMMAFFKRVLIKYNNAKFLFITGESPDIIYKSANANNVLQNNIIVVKAQRNDVPYYLKLSKLSIFFIKQTFSKKASSPTKQGEIMSIGIPLICNSGIGDTDYIINKSGCGLVIPKLIEEEYDKIIDKFDYLFNLSDNKIKQSAEEYFSLDKGIELYYNVYKMLEQA